MLEPARSSSPEFYITERTLYEIDWDGKSWRYPDVWDLLAYEYRRLCEHSLEWRLANPVFPRSNPQLGSTREGWREYVRSNGWNTVTVDPLVETSAYRVQFSLR